MDLTEKSLEELQNMYRTLNNVDKDGGMENRKAIRKEMFRRGVEEINGVPLETLLRNPVLKEEYEEATGGTN